MPIWESRMGETLATTTAFGSQKALSKLSESGASRWNLLPMMAVIWRSVTVVEPALSQVWALPSRVMSCMPMNLIQASVTGRRISMRSPMAKPVLSATLKEAAPEGTYLSEMEVWVEAEALRD